jgi:hypothetical protein
MLAGSKEEFFSTLILTMNSTIRALLGGLIDYAGLFPPATLEMTQAVRNYASYLQGGIAWMLGRFVLPLGRLKEFEEAAEGYLPKGGAEGSERAWRLSVLGNDLEKITGFNYRSAQRAVIDTVEIKAVSVEDIQNSMKSIPESITVYFEIPTASDPTDLIKAIAEEGARAKARTGGVTEDAFPSSFNLSRFIKVCADEDVPFKATAGLHHPLRSVNKLTYEPDSGTILMHGFLNVFLAAGFAQNGMEIDQLIGLLEERSPDAFQFKGGSVHWRGQMLVKSQIRNARSLFAIAFGSCSFEEPVEDLKNLKFEI